MEVFDAASGDPVVHRSLENAPLDPPVTAPSYFSLPGLCSLRAFIEYIGDVKKKILIRAETYLCRIQWFIFC